MKNMTATEVLARQKEHAAHHGPLIQRAADNLVAALVRPLIDKVIEKYKLEKKK